MEMMSAMHPSIKFERVSSSSSLDFLDITIFKGPDFATTGTLSCKMFQKELNAFLYLHPKSQHPPHVFSSFIKERILSARKFCSEESDFEIQKSTFKSRLIKRGYTEAFLSPLFDAVIPKHTEIWAKLSAKDQNTRETIEQQYRRTGGRQT